MSGPAICSASSGSRRVAIAAEGLNAGIETAGLSFLPLYAIAQGWTEEGGTRLISCLMFGAILLQLPIGWLGDRMDRLRLAIALGLLAVGGALLWPLILNDPWIAYPVLFVWGGVFVGVYTLMMAVVGSRFAGTELVGIYAVMGLVWGLGACSARRSPAWRWTCRRTACRSSPRSPASPSRFTPPPAAALPGTGCDRSPDAVSSRYRGEEARLAGMLDRGPERDRAPARAKTGKRSRG